MKVIAPFLLVGLGPVVAGSAQEKECTREEAITAEATASGLRSWPEILESFRKFAHCDDGAIAQGYQVAIVAFGARGGAGGGGGSRQQGAEGRSARRLGASGRAADGIDTDMDTASR